MTQPTTIHTLIPAAKLQVVTKSHEPPGILDTLPHIILHTTLYAVPYLSVEYNTSYILHHTIRYTKEKAIHCTTHYTVYSREARRDRLLGPERPHKQKDPTNHDIWCPTSMGPWHQYVDAASWVPSLCRPGGRALLFGCDVAPRPGSPVAPSEAKWEAPNIPRCFQ